MIGETSKTSVQQLTGECDLAEGRTLRFRYKVDGIEREGFLARYQGQWVAYENRCRHQPVPLDYGDGRFFSQDGSQFLCQSHGATYEPLTGECVHGPCAGAKLVSLPVAVRDGAVWLEIQDTI